MNDSYKKLILIYDFVRTRRFNCVSQQGPDGIAKVVRKMSFKYTILLESKIHN